MKHLSNFRFAALSMFTVLLLAACSTSNDNGFMTADDYKKATHHLSKTMNPLVYNTITRSEWSDNEVVIYSKQVKGGKSFVKVNLTD